MVRPAIIGPYGPEPGVFTKDSPDYSSKLSQALTWYTYEKDKKDARAFLRAYISANLGKETAKLFDRTPDSAVKTTWGWVARLVTNGVILSDKHSQDLKSYVTSILSIKPELPAEPEVEKVPRVSVQDNMKEKILEYLGELEGEIDNILFGESNFDLYKDLQAKSIPGAYCPQISTWVMEKAKEFVEVYESTDSDVKEGYSNIGKRKVTSLIKTLSQWKEDLERYGQFKKANRKPRAKKVKSPTQQVAKLKYKKEDTDLKIKSVNPAEMVGASQVWIYNTKYKKLSVYRSDSTIGIQIKGTTLQNYDPDQSEQKALRKPEEILKKVLDSGKVQLRKIMSDLTTKESSVSGRINEECLIIRAL